MAHKYSLIEDGEISTSRQANVRNDMVAKAFGWVRLLFETILVILVVVLAQIVCQQQSASILTSDPVPSFPTRPVMFKQDYRFIDGLSFLNQTHMYHQLASWMQLTTKGRGFVDVAVDDWQAHNLLKPHSGDPFNQNKTASAHMVSVFHQLHCLSSMIEFYHRDLDEDMADHMAHCFDYLRQSIVCAADTTLEGFSGVGDGGFGVTHQCKNYDLVLDWANEHSPWDWVDGPTHL